MVGWWVARGQRGVARAFVTVAIFGFLVQSLLRFLIEQWRPDAGALPAAMDLRTRYELAGFTSGHAFRAAFLYGWWSEVLPRGRTGRSALGALACALLIAEVGWARIYFQRHWCSDVLGGWLVAGLALTMAQAQLSRRSAPAAERGRS
jgi:undecaprenyl-diphosphatase